MKVSNCCNYPVLNETDICSNCYEHCEVVDDEEEDEFDSIMKVEGKNIIQNNQVERSKCH